VSLRVAVSYNAVFWQALHPPLPRWPWNPVDGFIPSPSTLPLNHTGPSCCTAPHFTPDPYSHHNTCMLFNCLIPSSKNLTLVGFTLLLDVTFTSVYMRHIGSRWYISDLYVATMDS
jgi:hypothetical protein